jgi:hypothetical protein
MEIEEELKRLDGTLDMTAQWNLATWAILDTILMNLFKREPRFIHDFHLVLQDCLSRFPEDEMQQNPDYVWLLDRFRTKAANILARQEKEPALSHVKIVNDEMYGGACRILWSKISRNERPRLRLIRGGRDADNTAPAATKEPG